jgi:hypothetical protein
MRRRLLLKATKALPEAISCRLTEDDLAERLAAWQALGGRVDIIERTRFPGGFRLALRGRREDVELASELVAAERECCGWAKWELEPTSEGAILTVSGREHLIAPLADGFLAPVS